MTAIASDAPRTGTPPGRGVKTPQFAQPKRWVSQERWRKRAEGRLRLTAMVPDDADEANRATFSNGSRRHSSSFVQSDDEWEELSVLRRQVRELQDQLDTQAELADQQMREIEEICKAVRNKTNEQTSTIEAMTVTCSPLDAQTVRFGEHGYAGAFKSRYHALYRDTIPQDHKLLPDRIILVRHGESEGSINTQMYSYTPNGKLGLTERGWDQAIGAGQKIRQILEHEGKDFKLFFFLSPYRRSHETYEAIRRSFSDEEVLGACEDVQLREQDFGNFQLAEEKLRLMNERKEFGRFFYRFPNGESGADVYDRITIFEDHFVRGINSGRFRDANTNLVLVTHGLALRVILMRWFHWTVDQFLDVLNPANAEPIVLERIAPNASIADLMHTKLFYRMSPGSLEILTGCTEDMVSPFSTLTSDIAK